MEYIPKWNNIFDKFILVKQMRLTNVWSSPLRTVFPLSLTLVYLLCLWRRLYIFLLWMIHLDESINLKIVKSHFTRSYHIRCRMKYYSSYRLWFNFDKPSNVKKQSRHSMFLPIEQGEILFDIRFFLSSVWKQIPMPFKCNDVDAT